MIEDVASRDDLFSRKIYNAVSARIGAAEKFDLHLAIAKVDRHLVVVGNVRVQLPRVFKLGEHSIQASQALLVITTIGVADRFAILVLAGLKHFFEALTALRVAL